MRGDKNKARKTVRTECTRRRAAQEVAGNILGSKTTRQLRRVTFASVRVARRHRRGTLQRRTWPASFGRGFGSPSSKKPRLRNDPPTSAGHFSMRRCDQPASARHFAGPNMARAVWQGLCLVIVEGDRGSETTRHALRVTFAGTAQWNRSCWLDLLPQLLRCSLVTSLAPARALDEPIGRSVRFECARGPCPTPVALLRAGEGLPRWDAEPSDAGLWMPPPSRSHVSGEGTRGTRRKGRRACFSGPGGCGLGTAPGRRCHVLRVPYHSAGTALPQSAGAGQSALDVEAGVKAPHPLEVSA